MNKINLAAKLATFSEHYCPRTVGTFNGHDLMVVKLKGPFVWHQHDETDDFFLVIEGRLRIELRDSVVEIEPTGTPNTGDPSTAAPRTVI